MVKSRIAQHSKPGLLTWCLILTVLLVACSSGTASTPAVSHSPSPTTTWTPLPTPADMWPILMKHTPVPWTTPLPASLKTELDGTYVKNDPADPQWWNCRRCPDYLPAGGIWRLNLDKGVFRIYYTVTAWRSLGSFTIDGDRLYLFNDPYCQYETGEYIWRLEDGQLTLSEVDDPCSIDLRALNLTSQSWQSCQPPEGTQNESWRPPEGCEDEVQ